jgi:hypothetical protein
LWSIATQKRDIWRFDVLRADAFLVMMTLSQIPRPLYPRKATTLSFLHVLFVWGVELSSYLTKYDLILSQCLNYFVVAIDHKPVRR